MNNTYAHGNPSCRNFSGKLILAAAAISSLFWADNATAEQLSPQEALSRVYNSSPSFKVKTNQKLYYTESIDGLNTLYLFSNGEDAGYLMLSADDTSLPILGFSDDAALPSSPADLPPAMKWWMKQIARQVAENARRNVSPSPQKVVGDPIPHLMQTFWNQDEPFSLDCPTVGKRHCYTGCVATALAQILKYHNYPPQGQGSHSYTWRNPDTKQDTTLSFDYADTKFDWDIMVDRYYHKDSEESKRAVAKLMYACGVSVDMWYGTGGSGASTSSIAPAMIEYFGYDKGIRNYVRDYYGLNEWNQLVYDQLKEYGPVQYSGFGDTDGHSFVVDGYSNNGYFHLNWGWGGMSDGYYLLTALDPIEQGIGGAESAFDFSQDFVGNVKTENTTSKIYPLFLMSNAFTIVQSSVKEGEDIRVEGGLFSNSAGTVNDILFGLKMTPTDGGNPIYMHGPEYRELSVGQGANAFEVRIAKDLPDGTYTVTPAYRDSDGQWIPTPVKVGLRNSYTAVCTDGVVTFSPGESAAITARDFETPENIELRKNFEVSATLVNESDMEWYGSLCVALLDYKDPSIVMAKASSVPVDVRAGDTYDFRYESAFDPKDNALKPGEYYVAICHVSNGKYHRLTDLSKVYLTVDDETGIYEVTSSDEHHPIYDLQGLPVENPHNGIFIVNGHLVVK